MGTWLRVVFAVFVAAVGLLGILPSSGWALPQAPPGNSEIDQYLPTVPDSEGDNPLGGGGAGLGGGGGGGQEGANSGTGGDAGTALPPSTAASLRAVGRDGEAALSAAEQGTPSDPDAARLSGPDGAARSPGAGRPDAFADESIPGAAFDTLGQGDGLGIVLPILLGAVACAGVLYVLRDRLPRRRQVSTRA